MIERNEKDLELALKTLEKSMGKGIIQRLGDKPISKLPSISTGSIGLNKALGIGGLPIGRIIEIYGPESSGKTTLTLEVIASAQKNGMKCVFVDAEHALDPLYASTIGVNTDDLWVTQPDYGEQALEIVDTIIRSNGVDLIVVDSVAALTPKVEIDGEMEDQQMGLQARMLSKGLRKFTGLAHKNNVTVIFINQIREKIGGISFGSNETTTGGRALKFYSSVRLDIRRIKSNKVGEEVVSNTARVKVVKNKVAPPFKQAEFDIEFGTGISNESEIIDYGVKYDIIDKSGSWFSYEETKLGQGKENVKKLLKEDNELREELLQKINEKLEEE